MWSVFPTSHLVGQGVSLGTSHRRGRRLPDYFTAWHDGHPLDPETPGYAKTLLDQLAWWAGALKSARETTPYPA